MSKDDVRKIKASVALQQKVGTGKIDEKAVEKAQAVMSENKVDFTPLALPQIELLQEAIKNAKGGREDEELMNDITLPIMNLKANAATFNYPIISEICGTVLTFLEHVGKIDDEVIVIVDNLCKAVMVIVSQKITDKENPVAVGLIKEFKDVCKRYMEKRL